MKGALNKIVEHFKDPRLQMECVNCKKKYYYQMINAYGRCMWCPSLLTKLLDEAIRKKLPPPEK